MLIDTFQTKCQAELAAAHPDQKERLMQEQMRHFQRLLTEQRDKDTF